MPRYLRRYGLFIFIALTILLIQFLLALSFYTSNQFEEQFSKDVRIKRNHQLNLKRFSLEPNPSLNKYTGSVGSEKGLTLSNGRSGHFQQRQSQSSLYSSAAKKPNNVKSNSKLDLSSLGFLPNCSINLKDAIYAINRAKTVDCKKQLANIACHLQSGQLFPEHLPQFCPYSSVRKKESINNYLRPYSKSIRIAFVLILNGRSVRQITRLIKAIYSPRHIYFIHVDKRQDFLFQELMALERLPNIKLSRNRLSTIWGGASLLDMLISSFQQLLNYKNWDYLINLSESDFPIKSLQKLESFLSLNSGHNFVKSHGQDTQRFLAKQGLDKTFHQCDDHMWRLGDRKIPSGIHIDGGSDWIGLTRDFCQYIIDNDDELLQGLRVFFKYTLLPAETFFHTVLRNSAFCDTIIDNNLHVTNWRRSQGCRCQYRHIVDWCGCSPNDFKLEDWSRIVDSLEKPLFFARKFEPSVNQEIINRIELLITKNKAKLASSSYDKYWQNDYHDKFDSTDDAKHSFYYLLSLLSSSHIGTICTESVSSFRHIPSSIGVKEAHIFFANDSYVGSLVTHTDWSNDRISPYSFETYFHPMTNLRIANRSISPEIKFVSVKVCSDYDMKEQIFRNFGCILNPFSEIGVNHRWSSDGRTNFSVFFVWIDPVEHVAGSFEVQIEWPRQVKNNSQSLTLYHKPNFNHPLRPGTWRLKILFKWKLIAESEFLVLPLIFKEGKPLDLSTASKIHSGPNREGQYSDHNFTAVSKLLKLRLSPESLDVHAETNSRKTGAHLIEWSLQLLEKFWTIHDVCFLGQTFSCQRAQLPLCHSTDWSSFYPDLKSKLT